MQNKGRNLWGCTVPHVHVWQHAAHKVSRVLPCSTADVQSL